MMGAKNHAVVLPDANKKQTINALAGFGAAGQRCMTTLVVVFVGASKEWIPELVECAKTLMKVNAGAEPIRTWGRSSRRRRKSAFSI